MPIPKIRNVGKIMDFIKGESPGMPRKQKIAIALNTARRAGAKIPLKKEVTGRSKKS